MPDLVATVVMPVRNEAAHIERALAAVLAQDVADGALLVIVADGMSDDATRAIVQGVADGARFRVRIVDNPGRIAATGLNVAIAAATTDVVVRVDGHCAIPPDYVRRLVEVLARTGAAAAGGVVRPVGHGATGEVIATALRHPLAHGGAAFRSGGGEERDVDTVPFPAYRKQAFLAAGGFDETLERNQDDDLHLRLRSRGERIVLVPGLVVDYECRASLPALRRQYFGYGVWKAVGWRRNGRPTSWRALAPALEVLFLGGAAVCGVLAALAVSAAGGPSGPALALVVLPVVASWLVYGLAMIVAFTVAHPPDHRSPGEHRQRDILSAIFTMHLAYGLGFWWGVLRLGRPPGRRAG